MEILRVKSTFGLPSLKKRRLYILQFTLKEPWLIPKRDKHYGENKNIVLYGWLFVHFGYQRKGIATAICNQLESAVQGNIVTHASITARPFFETRGYKVIKEQQVERQGILLTNFIMIMSLMLRDR